MNEVKKAIYPNKTPSPPGSDDRERNPSPLRLSKDMQDMKTLIHLTHLFPMQVPLKWSLTQLGGDFGQQGHPFDAPPPPSPEQPRPSMVDQIAADIFDDPNPGMASSIHTSLTHTTMPSFFGSSLYIVSGSH
jgi:hypothetical protein